MKSWNSSHLNLNLERIATVPLTFEIGLIVLFHPLGFFQNVMLSSALYKSRVFMIISIFLFFDRRKTCLNQILHPMHCHVLISSTCSDWRMWFNISNVLYCVSLGFFVVFFVCLFSFLLTGTNISPHIRGVITLQAKHFYQLFVK